MVVIDRKRMTTRSTTQDVFWAANPESVAVEVEAMVDLVRPA